MAPVLVFTWGRKGSMLLIRMLNWLLATTTRGEHDGSLKPLLTSHSCIRDDAGSRFVTKAAEHQQVRRSMSRAADVTQRAALGCSL